MRSHFAWRAALLFVAAACVACSRLGSISPTSEPSTASPPGVSATPVAQPQEPSPDPTITPSAQPADTPSPDPTDTPEPDPTDTPEPDPTDTPEPDPTYPRIPSAARVIDCQYGIGSSYENPWSGVTFGDTPEAVLEEFLGDREFKDMDFPLLGFERIRETDQIVVLAYSVDQVAKAAIVVAHDPPLEHGPANAGWVGISVARCDISEMGLDVVLRRDLGVWRNFESELIGIDYQGYWCLPHSARFLHLGQDFPTYVRDPEDAFDGALSEPYDGNAVLPDDAVDTGYVRGDDALWRAKGGGAMYIVRPDVVEMWPKLDDDWACA